MPPVRIETRKIARTSEQGKTEKLQQQARAKRDAGDNDEHLARRRGGGMADRLFVLEPRTHARFGDRFGNRRRRELRGVVTDTQTLADEIRNEILEPGQRLQPALENRHLLAAIHAFDLEDRLGVDFADGACDLLVSQS